MTPPDRNGEDVGRSVEAWGWWGDMTSSPYHCFGEVTTCEDFFRKQNKVFVRTAVDVALYNLQVGGFSGWAVVIVVDPFN